MLPPPTGVASSLYQGGTMLKKIAEFLTLRRLWDRR